MKTSNQEKRTFDLADLIFTKDNENEGVWVEPELFGVKIGVEFKVIGANCDKLITVIEEFNKKYAEVSAIKDTTERAKALDELYVDTAAKRTIGLRCAADAEVTIEETCRIFKMQLFVIFLKNLQYVHNLLSCSLEIQKILRTGRRIRKGCKTILLPLLPL